MKKLLYNLEFLFDYYIGYHLCNGKTHYKWSDYIINKYPEKFPNEHKYLNQKNEKK